MKKLVKTESEMHMCTDRRSMMKSVFGVAAASMVGAAGLGMPEISFAASLTKEERDKMTPDEIIEGLKKGNMRFRQGKMKRHDYVAQKKSSSKGQFPSTTILSCIDSRAPAEILFDTGIGETFNARVAGNVSNSDIIGSMEFACAVVGAKVVVVMGHTACGAIRGAIDDVKLGSLTGLLNEIKPSIELTKYKGERVGTNDAFVDEVAITNVRQTIANLRKGSQILTDLEKDGKIKMVGAMYNLKDGKVDFLS